MQQKAEKIEAGATELVAPLLNVNNIEVIYVLKPIKFSNFEIYINENCTTKYQENLILTSHIINKCEDLKKF